ncbi:hypothetical protein RZS08_43160, partial [Arthrospira platensis SPKY1]|nr:hypothetical protein [Arthrospira platensis SPKY1]
VLVRIVVIEHRPHNCVIVAAREFAPRYARPGTTHSHQQRRARHKALSEIRMSGQHVRHLCRSTAQTFAGAILPSSSSSPADRWSEGVDDLFIQPVELPT